MITRLAGLALALMATVAQMSAQGRVLDWPSYGGDARRSGWERSDSRITPENIKDFKLVLKRKLPQPNGITSLTPPVIIGVLISYRGFKELGFVSGGSGHLWALDVDMDKMFWEKRLSQTYAPGCAGAAPPVPALTPPTIFGGARSVNTRAAVVNPVGTPVSPGQPPTPAGRTAPLPARLSGTAPRPLYALTADGKLHLVNTSTGDDQFPPLNFLPPNAKASPLTLNANVIYTTTSGNCGGSPNAIWAIDLALEETMVASFPLNGGAAGGLGGYAIGNDGTVYVQTGPGASDPTTGKWSNTLLALAPRNLKLQHHFTVKDDGVKRAAGINVTTPVVFEYKDRDLVVSAGIDGSLHLFDSRSLTLLSKTPAVGGMWGGVSTWEDADGIRWVAVPVWGAVNAALKAPTANGAAPNGSIVAFRVEELNGKPALTPAWVSRDMRSPQPPVITTGAVFALSSGGPGPATMYALDAATGKEIYSTGNQVTAPANLTGMTVANGRIFFTTTDSTLYGFGVYMER